MPFRFRRSLRLFPGVRLNFSRSGVSASLGVRGATINLGRRGARATVGLPGTGLSYTTRPAGLTPGDPVASAPDRGGGAAWVIAGVLAATAALVGLSRTTAPPAAAPAASAPVPAPTLTVTAHGLNCRASPRSTAVLVRRLPSGTRVTVGRRSGRWVEIAWIGGPCWALGRYLR